MLSLFRYFNNLRRLRGNFTTFKDVNGDGAIDMLTTNIESVFHLHLGVGSGSSYYVSGINSEATYEDIYGVGIFEYFASERIWRAFPGFVQIDGVSYLIIGHEEESQLIIVGN